MTGIDLVTLEELEPALCDHKRTSRLWTATSVTAFCHDCGALWFPEDDVEPESNFGLYVDGFMLASTCNIGEIAVTHPDGRTKVLKSKSLTDFFEWRFEE